MLKSIRSHAVEFDSLLSILNSDWDRYEIVCIISTLKEIA